MNKRKSLTSKRVTTSKSLLASIESKKKNILNKSSRSNAFACGKNGQNRKVKETLSAEKRNDDGNDDSNSVESEWEDNLETLSSQKENSRKKKRKTQKTARCWKFFKEISSLHPKTKKKCQLSVCIVKKNNKICGKELVYLGSNSRMNSHLYNEHDMKKFRKKLSPIPEVQVVMELMAKFIISSNSPFRIVENKYLIVSVSRNLFRIFSTRSKFYNSKPNLKYITLKEIFDKFGIKLYGRADMTQLISELYLKHKE